MIGDGKGTCTRCLTAIPAGVEHGGVPFSVETYQDMLAEAIQMGTTKMPLMQTRESDLLMSVCADCVEVFGDYLTKLTLESKRHRS